MSKEQIQSRANSQKRSLIRDLSIIISLFALGVTIGSIITPESFIVKAILSFSKPRDEVILIGSGTVKSLLEEKVDNVSFLAGPSMPALRSFLGICEDDISENLKLIAMSATDASTSDILEPNEEIKLLKQNKKIVQIKIGSAYLEVITYPKRKIPVKNENYILVDELYDLMNNNKIDLLYKTSPNSGTERDYLKILREDHPKFNFPEEWNLFDKDIDPDILFKDDNKRKLILCNSIYSIPKKYISSKTIGIYKIRGNEKSDAAFTDLFLYFMVTPIQNERNNDNAEIIYKPDETIKNFLNELSKDERDFYYPKKDYPGILLRDSITLK